MLIGMVDAALSIQDQAALRPRYHFTAKAGWLNDPNGLVFYKGEYHLFFQHNPYGAQWGNMTWGHAVSKDLVHWKQVENALAPDELGTMFSGSAVVDKTGAAGFGKGALILFYTAAGGTNVASRGKPFTQCLAWSTDGRTFHKYDGNPIVAHIEAENRDPKVVWHEPTKSWVMALYLNNSKFAILTSKTLKDWTKASELTVPGTDECPDLFEIPLDGDRSHKRWIFSGANGNYMVGSFDGKVFTPETPVLASNHGPNSYAAQAYFNDPKGRVVQMGWMRGVEFPGCSWNQQMSVPRILTLRSTSDGPRLFSNPAPELKRLRNGEYVFLEHKGGGNLDARQPPKAFEIELRADVGADSGLTLEFGGRTVSYESRSGVLKVGSHPVDIGKIKDLRLHIFIDTASVEVFAQDGQFSIPVYTPFEQQNDKYSIHTTGSVKLKTFKEYALKSAWPELTGG